MSVTKGTSVNDLLAAIQTRRVLAREALRDHLKTMEWEQLTPSQIRILDAYLRLATTHGYDSVSMRMIAKSIGIQAPSIYAHFAEGKDQIVSESLRWHFHRFGTALLDVTDDHQTPDEFWASMVRLHFTRQLTLPESNMWDLLVQTDRTAAIFPPDLRARVATWVGIHEDMYVAAAIDLGYPTPQRSVRAVVALLESTTRWTDANESSLDVAADRVVQLSRHMLLLSDLQ